MEGVRPPCILIPTHKRRSKLFTDWPPTYKRAGVRPQVSSAAAQLTPVPLSCRTSGLVPLLSVLPQTQSIIMFSKIAPISLLLSALYVNALSIPVAREPAPEPECEFPRSFLTTCHHDLTLVSFIPR